MKGCTSLPFFLSCAALDATPRGMMLHPRSPPARLATRQAGDDDVEDADEAVDDGFEDVADAGHDRHEAVADRLEDLLDLYGWC